MYGRRKKGNPKGEWQEMMERRAAQGLILIKHRDCESELQLPEAAALLLSCLSEVDQQKSESHGGIHSETH